MISSSKKSPFGNPTVSLPFHNHVDIDRNVLTVHSEHSSQKQQDYFLKSSEFENNKNENNNNNNNNFTNNSMKNQNNQILHSTKSFSTQNYQRSELGMTESGIVELGLGSTKAHSHHNQYRTLANGYESIRTTSLDSRNSHSLGGSGVIEAGSNNHSHHHNHSDSCSHDHNHNSHSDSHYKVMSASVNVPKLSSSSVNISSSAPLLGTATASVNNNVNNGVYPDFSNSNFFLRSFLPFALETIMSEKRTRKIGYFVLINFTFTAVELIVGWMSNSLGLLGDGVHMLFDSVVLTISLMVVVISRYSATLKYSYGFTRAETLTALINALLLFYAAGSIVVEALHRFVYPEEMEADKTIVVSILGLLVNIIGIFAFDSHSMLGHDHHHHDHHHHHHHHDHHHHDHHHHDHHHDHHHHEHSDIFQGMFLHVLADTLGSVFVIVSSIIVHFTGWKFVDPFCSLILSLLIMYSSWPLMKRCMFSLMSVTPDPILSKLPQTFDQVMKVPGVLSYYHAHFWEQSTDYVVGSLNIIVSREMTASVDLFRIKEQVSQIMMDRLGLREFTLQLDQQR